MNSSRTAAVRSVSQGVPPRTSESATPQVGTTNKKSILKDIIKKKVLKEQAN